MNARREATPPQQSSTLTRARDQSSPVNSTDSRSYRCFGSCTRIASRSRGQQGRAWDLLARSAASGFQAANRRGYRKWSGTHSAQRVNEVPPQISDAIAGEIRADMITKAPRIEGNSDEAL